MVEAEAQLLVLGGCVCGLGEGVGAGYWYIFLWLGVVWG